MRASTVNQVLSQLDARNDKYQNETAASRGRRRKRASKRGTRGGEFFAIRARHGRLRPGIYERITTGYGSAVRSIFVFVRSSFFSNSRTIPTPLAIHGVI